MTNQERFEKANEIVKKHVIFAVGGGLIPVPFLDIAAVTAVQIDMVNQLCQLYNKNFTDTIGKSIIGSLAGSTLARMGASLVKGIPGIGTIIGEISMPILSGASTYAIGNVFINHLSQGGNLEDFESEKYKDDYKKYYNEGKKVAEDLKKEVPESEVNIKDKTVEVIPQKDYYAELKKVTELKTKGIISAEEYEPIRLDLLNKIKESLL